MRRTWISLGGANGCTTSSEEVLGTDDDVTAPWAMFDCADAPLHWIVLKGGGHDWPGAAREVLLGSTGPIDATALIWEFFEGV